MTPGWTGAGSVCMMTVPGADRDPVPVSGRALDLVRALLQGIDPEPARGPSPAAGVAPPSLCFISISSILQQTSFVSCHGLVKLVGYQ
jgi:hypothetical protein